MIDGGRLTPITLPARRIDWEFAAPFGPQPMVELSFSEVVTIARHLRVNTLHSYLNASALEQVRDGATPAPAAIDTTGRSAQRFMLEVAADGRRARASGQDIYAVSAPIAVEAAMRLLDPAFQRHGALSLGQAFEPRAFLDAIASPYLFIDLIEAAAGAPARALR
jgi:hypothetical protein